MKLTFVLVLTSALTANAAHHCNEFTSNISTPRKFWMGGRKHTDETHEEEQPDLVHRKDLHSWTGAKGIDHHLREIDCDKNRRPHAHKEVQRASSDLIHRHDMHSFLGIEGLDHHTESETLSEPHETPVAKHARRRLDRSRTPNLVKAVKDDRVKVVKTLNKDVPGERLDRLSSTVYFNHGY